MVKTAIVTGGTRGIGYAIAKRLGKDGFAMVITGTKPASESLQVIGQLEREGIQVRYIQADIANSHDRIHLVEETVRIYGRIDVLVNNAGVAPKARRDILEMTEESYDWVMDINTKGTMFLTQVVAREMINQEPVGKKNGTIINISSCSADVSSIGRGEYCISKAGISMLTKLYADRLAGEGILVQEIRPGIILTDMTVTVKEKYDKMLMDEAFPIRRWGIPEDVADAAAFFAGDQCLYTTGSYLDVDGGFHIRRL